MKKETKEAGEGGREKRKITGKEERKWKKKTYSYKAYLELKLLLEFIFYVE